MHRNVNDLIGNSIEATDGGMGKVEEFYFNDQAWIIAYLVVKTGSWLLGRKVLISPYALLEGRHQSGILPVKLTKEQVKHSPDIDTYLPVSRQQELALHHYYPWQSYWATEFYKGGIWGILTTPVDGPTKALAAEDDHHLRSTHATEGYHIETRDGELGHLQDFIIDDETWHIEYLVIEMHSWFNRKKVLIAREHIKEIQWATSKILVDVTSDVLENSKPYDKSALFQETVDTDFDKNIR